MEPEERSARGDGQRKREGTGWRATVIRRDMEGLGRTKHLAVVGSEEEKESERAVS
jgi:hypothetical protein